MPFGIGRSRRQVALCSIDGEEVAKGTVRAMENRQFITRLVLSSSEVAICIDEVLVPSQEVNEIFLYNIEDYWNKVI